MDNTFYNPVNGETTTILKSAAQTSGNHTLFEVTLAPGGGNPLHYHTKFTEEFFAVSGQLGLQKNKIVLYLEEGQSVLVPANTPHRFFNDGKTPITFRVKLVSGQPDFENFLKVMFGLVNDNKTFGKTQIPKNMYHIAIAFVWGNTHLANPVLRLLSPLVSIFYKRALRLGIDKKLLIKYCS